jgi:hypothetical protein
MTKEIVCPSCEEAEAVEIVYGLPSDEGVAAARRGDIILGGCCYSPNKPTQRCRACGNEWISKEGAEPNRDG